MNNHRYQGMSSSSESWLLYGYRNAYADIRKCFQAKPYYNRIYMRKVRNYYF